VGEFILLFHFLSYLSASDDIIAFSGLGLSRRISNIHYT